MSSEDAVIDVRHLTKSYEVYATPRDRLKQFILPKLHRLAAATRLSRRTDPVRYYREFQALQDVSFQVRRGETVGIIGRNGSGKSTLLQIIAGTLAPTDGSVSVKGRIAALLELGSGFDPEFTGRENVFLNGRILGLTQQEIEERLDQILAFADIGDFIDQPVKTYSSGMFVRLAFAVQAHIEASIIIIDEALAVGDVFFRQKCYARLEQLRASGAAILLVTHSMPDIEQYCERAVLLDQGRVRFMGPATEAAKHYYLLHQSSPRKGEIKAALDTSTPALQQDEQGVLPQIDAFIDLATITQASNGQARCVAAALCDLAGNGKGHFRQGEYALFYYEFEAEDDFEVPVCGLTIANERGVIVHGKNSWQASAEAPTFCRRGSRIICRQQIRLDLGLGEYTFQVGLVSVPLEAWDQRKRIPFEEEFGLMTRICHTGNVTSFTIGLQLREGVSCLTHHGVADLPSSVEIACHAPAGIIEPNQVDSLP